MSPAFPSVQKVLVTALLSGTRLRSTLAAVPACTPPMWYNFHVSRATLPLRGLPLPLKQCGLWTAWGTTIRPWLDVLCLALQETPWEKAALQLLSPLPLLLANKASFPLTGVGEGRGGQNSGTSIGRPSGNAVAP